MSEKEQPIEKIIIPENVYKEKIKNDSDEKIDNNCFKDDSDDQVNKESILNENRYFRATNSDDAAWNYKIRLMLKKLGEKSIGYKWMHDKDAQNDDENNKKYSIIEVVLLTILGALTGGEFLGLIFSAGLYFSRNFLIAVVSVQIVFIIACGSIKGYKDVNNFEESIWKHTYAGQKFNEIFLGIQEQFALNLNDRDTDKVFLKNIVKQYDDLMLISPQISKGTMKDYIKATENYDIYKPSIVGGIDTIEIVIDDNRPKTVAMANINPHQDRRMIDNLTSNKNLQLESKLNYEIDRWLRHY